MIFIFIIYFRTSGTKCISNIAANTRHHRSFSLSVPIFVLKINVRLSTGTSIKVCPGSGDEASAWKDFSEIRNDASKQGTAEFLTKFNWFGAPCPTFFHTENFAYLLRLINLDLLKENITIKKLYKSNFLSFCSGW